MFRRTLILITISILPPSAMMAGERNIRVDETVEIISNDKGLSADGFILYAEEEAKTLLIKNKIGEIFHGGTYTRIGNAQIGSRIVSHSEFYAESNCQYNGEWIYSTTTPINGPKFDNGTWWIKIRVQGEIKKIDEAIDNVKITLLRNGVEAIDNSFMEGDVLSFAVRSKKNAIIGCYLTCDDSTVFLVADTLDNFKQHTIEINSGRNRMTCKPDVTVEHNTITFIIDKNFSITFPKSLKKKSFLSWQRELWGTCIIKNENITIQKSTNED